MNYQNNLVSVCIPTYNGAKYLEAALGSVEQQTYKNIEVIISDDNSQDNTISIVESFKNKVIFPVHIYHHNPSGIGANWNNSLKHADGVYIKFLFQDDLLYPTCIEEMVLVFEKEKKIGLVSAKRDILIEGEITLENSKWIKAYKDLQLKLTLTSNNLYILNKSFFSKPEFLLNPLNKIGEPSGILFRKSLLGEIGFFREDMIQILDLEFYNRVLKKHEIAIINKELYAFRIHAMQATNINKGSYQEDFTLYKKILFSDYFWYLNSNVRQHLLDTYTPLMGKIFRKFRKFL